MPEIPRPSITSVASAPVAGVLMSPEAAAAPARGMMAVAAGLRQGAAVLAEYAQRSAEAKDQGDLARASLVMDKASADIQDALAGDADYTTWQDKAQKRIDQAKSELLAGGKYSARVSRLLDEQFSAWSERTALTVRNQANRAQDRSNDRALVTAATLAYQNGRIEEGDSYADQRAELGLADGATVREFKRIGRESADAAAFDRQLGDDPVLALEQIRDRTDGGRPRFFTNLDEQRRRSMEIAARQAVSAKRAETLDAMRERIEVNNEWIEPAELEGLVKKGWLTAYQSKGLMSLQQQQGLDPIAPTQFALALQQAANWKPEDDNTREKWGRIIDATATLPRPWAAQVREVLNKRERGDSASAEAHLSRLYSAGLFGDTKFDTVNASTRFVDAQAKFAAWQREHPSATPQEQTSFINSLVREQVTDPTDVLNALSGRAQP